MASVLFDVELWREYSRQSQAFGKAVMDPRSKHRLLAVVAAFDGIAKDDVNHWRECAKQTRAISKAMNNAEIKEHMLAIAAGFECVGDLANKLRSRGEKCGRAQRRKWRRLFSARSDW